MYIVHKCMNLPMLCNIYTIVVSPSSLSLQFVVSLYPSFIWYSAINRVVDGEAFARPISRAFIPSLVLRRPLADNNGALVERRVFPTVNRGAEDGRRSGSARVERKEGRKDGILNRSWLLLGHRDGREEEEEEENHQLNGSSGRLRSKLGNIYFK